MICKECGKEFVSETKYIYCSKMCYNRSIRKQCYINAKKNKMKKELQKTINDIRIHWDFLRTHFPKKAKKIIEEMNREEEPEFIELMLNGFKEIKVDIK